MSYPKGKTGLVHGGPLVVEDLDVTMKCVTYIRPRIYTLKDINRLVKNLRLRKIPFKMKEQFYLGWNPFIPIHCIQLEVGDRQIGFDVQNNSRMG